jgi:hypothetical protein
MIRWAFLNPDSPACFSSADRVWKLVKKRFPKLTIHDVVDVLQRLPTYTRHKARRNRFPRLKTVTAGFMEDVQVDLADFQQVSEHNKGYNYILVILFHYDCTFRLVLMFCRGGCLQNLSNPRLQVT